jgi:hypothetical protein
MTIKFRGNYAKLRNVFRELALMADGATLKISRSSTERPTWHP